MAAAVIECRGLWCSFKGVEAVRGIDLTLSPGDSISVMGPSGGGKTSLLRMIAGLLIPDQGTIRIGGEIVSGPGVHVPPERRGVVLVFQDLALFPHLTLQQNAAFGLGRDSKWSIAELLDRVQLAGMDERYPHELSGGQRQRAAIARALAADPQVVLLDEPFSSLDVLLRPAVRTQVRNILSEAGVSSLLTTHDLASALGFADKLAVMIRGRLVQSGHPRDLYREPVSQEVASLLGTTNLIPGLAQGRVADCEIGAVRLAMPFTGRVLIAVRPENLTVERSPASASWVTESAFAGDHTLVRVQLSSGQLVAARADSGRDLEAGTAVRVKPSGENWAFPMVEGATGGGLRVSSALDADS